MSKIILNYLYICYNRAVKIKDLLLPTNSNNHSPHILQKVSMLMMVGLVLLSFAMTNLQALWWQSSDWLVGAVLPAVVVDLTNKERGDLYLNTLTRSQALDEAARLKAEHMAKNSYFAHYSPDGVTPWYWFEQVSYKYLHAGENLAIHFTDSKSVVDAWMNSPTHRANITNQKFTEIGVGTAKGVYEGYNAVFVVQLFGAPALDVENNLPLPTVSINDWKTMDYLKSSEQLASIATQPNFTLQILYLSLGALVVFSLIISMLVSLYHKRLRQVVYGVFLLLLMSGLFYLHYSLINNVVIASS
jgi:hypothetical protein